MRAYVSSPLLHRNVLIIFVDTRLELQLPGQEQEIASHSLDPIFPRATDLSPTFHHFSIRCLPTSPANHFISPLINARGRIEGNVSIIAAIDRRETRWFFLLFFFSWRKELEARTGKVSSILRNENVALMWTCVCGTARSMLLWSIKLSCFSIKILSFNFFFPSTALRIVGLLTGAKDSR